MFLAYADKKNMSNSCVCMCALKSVDAFLAAIHMMANVCGFAFYGAMQYPLSLEIRFAVYVWLKVSFSVCAVRTVELLMWHIKATD